MQAIYLMMQADHPDNYIVATGCACKVEEIISCVFSLLDLNYEECIETNATLFRKDESPIVYGSSQKLLDAFGWRAETTLQAMLKEMVEFELKRYSVELRNDPL